MTENQQSKGREPLTPAGRAETLRTAAGAVHAAVAGGTLTDDTARAILNCIDADGCIDAPNDLLESVAREVIEAAGVEFRLAKAPDLLATPGETDRTPPRTEAPDADRGQKGPASASSQGSKRPQKRRKGRNRTQPPDQPATPSASDEATQATPSRPRKAPDERRIAWAWANQDDAAALLRANGRALAEHADPDITHPHTVETIANQDAWLLRHAAFKRAPSLELLQAAENLGVLAHAIEHYRPNSRENPILPAATAGAPAIHVRQERLPDLTRLGPVQASFGFVPRTPGHVLPVFVYNADKRIFEVAGNRGVPIPWRLWYETLLSAPLAAYGREAKITPTLGEVVQWAGWKRWEPSKHLEPLAESLLALRNMAFRLKDELWFPMSVINVPATAEFDLRKRIQIRIDLPPGSRQGPQVDRLALRGLAPRSAPRYRGLLGLSAYWDKYGRGRGGADALATNPEAIRWPVLTPETLRLMMFPRQPASAAVERQHRKRAVEHTKAMQAANLIEMVPHGDGWRVYRPS
ncbi:MAG: hypothetical protein OXG74_13780 [Acidobacteria bacterium]|nr:hypothetical protein [Acidobacteriota bacterium]